MAASRRLRLARLHLTILIVLPGFLALADWQLHRALGGNSLSWAYAVEWPLFAVYAIVLWWRLVQEERGVRTRRSWPLAGARAARAERRARRDAEEERERLAYNAYLAAMRADDERTSGA